MSIETKSENNASTIDNKALFGPLGKYAITGVILGSVIVTTAIMLDRHQDTPTEHIAAIEQEIAELNTTASTDASNTSAVAESVSNQLQNSIEVAVIDVTTVEAEAATAEVVDSTVAEATEVPVVKQSVAEQSTTKLTTDTVAGAEQTNIDTYQTTEQTPANVQTVAAHTKQSEAVVNNGPTKAFAPQLSVDYRHQVDNRVQQWRARIQARDLEYKQDMAEYYSEINLRDSERLQQYKKDQNDHVAFLREQIARQEQLIDELIMRNKETYEMREARIQRRHVNREQMLNRI